MVETIYEREFILNRSKTPPSNSGFTTRPINKLTNAKATPDILNIETNHFKRDIKKSTRDIIPLLEYQLWLEAGKMDKRNFKSDKADPNICFNSNIWRNFRQSAGLPSSYLTNGSVSESISALYPINIPVPSNLGPNSLAKFYEQNKKSLFKSEKSYKLASSKVDKEAAIMKYLRLKSEMRKPPLDYNGNILPPRNFKKYPPIVNSYTIGSISSSVQGFRHDNTIISNEENSVKNITNNNNKNQQIDSILINPILNSSILNDKINLESARSKVNSSISNSKSVKKHSSSKLTFKDNHPSFEKVNFDQQIKNVISLK